MKYYTYILYSEKLDRFYTGQTQNLEKRLNRHNSGLEKYTKKGVPWKIMCSVESETRSAAMKLERKIKNFKSQKRIRQYIQEVEGSEK